MGCPPKSFMLIGFSIVNHPFRGSPISGNPQNFSLGLYPIHPILPDNTKIAKVDELVGTSMGNQAFGPNKFWDVPGASGQEKTMKTDSGKR